MCSSVRFCTSTSIFWYYLDSQVHLSSDMPITMITYSVCSVYRVHTHNIYKYSSTQLQSSNCLPCFVLAIKQYSGKFSPQSFLSWQYQCMCYVSTLHMLGIGLIILLLCHKSSYFPGSKRHRTSVPSSSNVFLCFNIWAGEGLDSVFVACCFLFFVEWNGSSLS